MKKVIYVSTTREIEHGVPQRSILGPILFSLYINDLPLNIMGSKIVLFADDTNILVSEENINNFQYKLNNVMNGLQT
jgi:retron-type reverse transcriptase